MSPVWLWELLNECNIKFYFKKNILILNIKFKQANYGIQFSNFIGLNEASIKLSSETCLPKTPNVSYVDLRTGPTDWGRSAWLVSAWLPTSSSPRSCTCSHWYDIHKLSLQKVLLMKHIVHCKYTHFISKIELFFFHRFNI